MSPSSMTSSSTEDSTLSSQPRTTPANFFSLPLGMRQQIYEYTMEEPYHIFRDGLPPILNTKLQITQEIHDHCILTITIDNWNHDIFTSRQHDLIETDVDAGTYVLEPSALVSLTQETMAKLELFVKNTSNKGIRLNLYTEAYMHSGADTPSQCGVMTEMSCSCAHFSENCSMCNGVTDPEYRLCADCEDLTEAVSREVEDMVARGVVVRIGNMDFGENE
ncbi:hypothetical protein E4T38_05262 [Aureobasidium subglaciale]|nr:hypothetical protein E4T38_05262 [Aureobasidium subglaciale]KAI5215713.1 hypothetical protein E4T41_09480 [Aureobasidium subglaciale]KAI5220359.1 hypothetical protein E4T40_06026 [Aureobasidium subglaciale]KAI5253839.1 hypothetical protein E4T46_09454 [Aureobasidium subglaciale]